MRLRTKVKLMLYWVHLDNWLNQNLILKPLHLLGIEPPDWSLQKFFSNQEVELILILKRLKGG